MNSKAQTINRPRKKRSRNVHGPDPGRQLFRRTDRTRELRLALYEVRAQARQPLFTSG
jgi:hypothetical protein